MAYSYTDNLSWFSPKEQQALSFLRFVLDEQAKDWLPPGGTESVDFEYLYDFGCRQAIMGLMFRGLSRLKGDVANIAKPHVLKWYAHYLQIQKANATVYRDCASVVERFQQEYGLRSVVLKGQGIARTYPDPYSRTPGDIDLWVEGDPVQIAKVAKKMDGKAVVGYHHVQVDICKTPVEVHFFPSFMGNLLHEWRLRRYFQVEQPRQMEHRVDLPNNFGEIAVPTDDFNLVFQLSHIMHHFLFGGVGLRQVIDYFYLLKDGVITDEEKERILTVLRSTNMLRFASALMYVLTEVLGLPPHRAYVKPNKKLGMELLREILFSGNFGQHDHRFRPKSRLRLVQYMVESYRNFRFAWIYPSETVWGRPIGRWWYILYTFYLRLWTRFYNVHANSNPKSK